MGSCLSWFQGCPRDLAACKMCQWLADQVCVTCPIGRASHGQERVKRRWLCLDLQSQGEKGARLGLNYNTSRNDTVL